MKKRKSFLFFMFVIFCFTAKSNDYKKIMSFINKKGVVDFIINYRTDTVPNNLNVECRAILISAKNKQITVEPELMYKFFSSQQGSFQTNGRIILKDLSSIVNDTAIFTLDFITDNKLSKTLKIPINYRGMLLLNYSGTPGINGQSGQDGRPGMLMEDFEELPVNGESGKYGTRGQDGRKILIKVGSDSITYHKGRLVISIMSEKSEILEKFYVERDNSSVFINLDGGDGGVGGPGGNGGDGADGDRQILTSLGQMGAFGGKGGDGGNGGNGGICTIIFSSNESGYAGKIHVSVKGGDGGKGGKGGRYGKTGRNFSSGKEFESLSSSNYMERCCPPIDGKDGKQGQNGLIQHHTK